MRPRIERKHFSLKLAHLFLATACVCLSALSTFASDGVSRIVLRPGTYRGTLVVPARAGARLSIEGRSGTVVERIVISGAENVSLGGMRISPVAGDAGDGLTLSCGPEAKTMRVMRAASPRS